MVAECTPRTTRTGARKSVLTHELPSSLLSFSSSLLSFSSPLLSSSLPVPPLPSSPPLFPFSPPPGGDPGQRTKAGGEATLFSGEVRGYGEEARKDAHGRKSRTEGETVANAVRSRRRGELHNLLTPLNNLYHTFKLRRRGELTNLFKTSEQHVNKMLPPITHTPYEHTLNNLLST
jgi:hypothetical protein